MSCPCCSSDQPLEPGNPTNFLSNREMLEKIADFRQQPGNKTKAMKNLVCGGNRMGGVGWGPGLQGGGRLPHLQLPVPNICCNIPLVQGPPAIPEATHEHQESDGEPSQEEGKLTEG